VPDLIFELPDPSSARLWTVSLGDVEPGPPGTRYAFIARAGNDERRWLAAIDDGIRVWMQALQQLPSTQEQSNWCAGFIRLYRRRFREILASHEETYTVGQEQLAEFSKPCDGGSIDLVAREVEDILFDLAKLRGVLSQKPNLVVLPSGQVVSQKSRNAASYMLPVPGIWEGHEVLLRDSDDPLVRGLLPRFAEFHTSYAELESRLPPSTDRDVDRARSLITRLDILGTKAIWALDDARSRATSAPASSGAVAEPWPRERAVHIDSIHLSNLRRFSLDDPLELEPPAEAERGQWILLLGENGTGKTTLLRAIALALLEEDIAQSLVTRFSADAPLIRIDAPQPGTGQNGIKAEIKVHLTDHGQQPYGVVVSPAQGRERLSLVSAPPLRPPVFAYGCRRGNALGGPERGVDINPVDNVATLFDPEAHLIHADAWLRKLAYAAEKDESDRALFEAVRDLLEDRDRGEYPLLPGIRDIEVARDRTWVTGPGGQRVPLSSLSDGYLTTLGWLVDFLARWLEYARQSGYDIHPGFHKDMPAVVLVDELDLHLHPRWQTRIVPALASTFPRTTFIATTHNPLTLNGTVADERMRGAVHIIKGGEDGGLRIVQRDLPPGMRVDEVLTHDWFDLHSTLDADTLAKIDEHRELLRADVHEGDPRRLELEAELRGRLGRYADTPAERLAQELVASEFPDDEQPVTEQERDALKELYAKSVAQARGDSGADES
jgi:energy-coupling factor transporter ATP-binding protein EcfA2